MNNVTFVIKVGLAIVFAIWIGKAVGDQERSQLPDVGNDRQINDAVQIIWQIRFSKKWNDPLTAEEISAVRLGMDSSDYMLLQDAAWASGEVLKIITRQLTGNIEEMRGVETRITTSLDINAYFDPSSKKIQIPVGLLSAMYFTQWAKEEATVNSNLKPYLAEYLYLLSRNQFQRTSTTASTVIRLSEYATGKPWQPDNKLTKQTEAAVRKAMLDSITFIVGHEACHASLKHKRVDDSLISLQQEWSADDCSRKMIEGWYPGKTDPFLVLQVLAFNSLDNERNPKKSTSHPSPLCRIIHQTEAFPSPNITNSKVQLFFSSFSNFSKIFALKEKAQSDSQAREKLKHICGLS